MHTLWWRVRVTVLSMLLPIRLAKFHINLMKRDGFVCIFPCLHADRQGRIIRLNQMSHQCMSKQVLILDLYALAVTFNANLKSLVRRSTWRLLRKDNQTEQSNTKISRKGLSETQWYYICSFYDLALYVNVSSCHDSSNEWSMRNMTLRRILYAQLKLQRN